MNQQPREPASETDGEELDVHSVFLTLQGEGPLSGRRAVFLRLAGCNLECPGCDTEYTQGRMTLTLGAVLLRIREEIAPTANDEGLVPDALVVITGGEPLRQPIGPLVKLLGSIGYEVQIESNGTFAPDPVLRELLEQPYERLHLVVSPKTRRIHPRCRDVAHAFKYVLDHRSVSEEDGLPLRALEHESGRGVARPRPGAPVYLTPFDAGPGKSFDTGANMMAVARSCLRYGYVANLQIHKLMGLA